MSEWLKEPVLKTGDVEASVDVYKRQDYATVARWWADTVKGTGVSLYIGMADYLAGNSDPKSPWYGTTAIERQLALNDTLPQVAGRRTSATG